MTVTQPSPAPREVDRLVADLGSTDQVRRDTAIARLRVLGARAFTKLGACLASDLAPRARAGALAALEGADNPRAADLALGVLTSPDTDVVVAALDVLRGWVTREQGTRLLEAVAAVAVDRTRDTRVRTAALDALADLPEALTRPIREQAPPPESAPPPLDDPVAALEWVVAHGRVVTLARLHELVTRSAEREQAEGSAARRAEWTAVRGAAHRVLADRGSRVAVYDARDTVAAAATPLPSGFLGALARVGDADALESLARAWASASDGQWRTSLQETARQILRRHRLTARNQAVKGVRARWPGFL